MTKTILASLSGLSSDRTVLEAAVAAARIEGGHIQCLHTRIDAVETAAVLGLSSPRVDLHSSLQQIARQEEERSRHARQAFDEITKRHALSMHDTPGKAAPVSAAWKENQSFLNETLTEARYHELTVMARDEELASERIVSVAVPTLPMTVPAAGEVLKWSWSNRSSLYSTMLSSVIGIIASANWTP